MALEAIDNSASTELPNGGTAFTPEESCEIKEYERIVQFSKSVLAGTHPRVKIANPGRLGNLLDSSSHGNNTLAINLKSPGQVSETSPVTNSGESNTISKFLNSQTNLGSKTLIPNNPQINSSVSEKPEDLTKATIQLQRQKLERALREQVKHQRIVANALLQTSESLQTYDVSEVLSKALAIVPPYTSVANEPPAAAPARSSDSNSFDDNTFYSSKFETPESSDSAQDQKFNTNKLPSTGMHDRRHLEQAPQRNDKDSASNNFSGRNNNEMKQNYEPNSYSSNPPATSENSAGKNVSRSFHQGINKEEERALITQQITKNVIDTSTNCDSNQNLDSAAKSCQPPKRIPNQLDSSEPIPTPPRNYNSTPAAPQPARALPLTTASNPLILCENSDEAQPAQVSALRNVKGISSLDSSPKGRANDKRKEKKKKSKNKDSSTTESPHIKTEPRSTSPDSSMRRPQKRLRSQYTNEFNYSRPQPGLDQPLLDRVTDPSTWRSGSHEHRPQTESPEYEPRFRQSRSNDVSRRTPSGTSARWPHSPQASAPYLSSGAHPRAVSSLVAGRIQEDSRYIREPSRRGSVHPDVHHDHSRSPVHETIPPGPLRQILVDEHGRQYYNATPAPAAPMVQPIGSTVRYRNDDLMYECLPPRNVLGRIPIEAYENQGILIRRRSPVYTASRRIVTQPEYISSPSYYRSYHHRGLPVYPTAINPHSEEYDPYRITHGYRQTPHFEESSGEYLRATTTRPEVPDYEMSSKDYIDRMPLARSDRSPHGAEVRRDTLPRAQREYSARPIATPSQREPYPIERYYEIPPRVVSHPEHFMSHGSTSYYNEPLNRRPAQDLGPIRSEEMGRYEDRYRRRPTDDNIIDQDRARESSVILYAEKPRRDVFR